MRALDLDFRRARGDGKWTGMALLVLGLAAATMIGREYEEVTSEVEQVEAALRSAGAVARKRTEPVRPGLDLQKLAREVKRASGILVELNVPWGELFSSVESASIPTVALLSIESDSDGHRVKITGEAKDLDAMLEYARTLETKPPLKDVFLQRHEVQQQDPQRPVRFLLAANWQMQP